MRSTVLLQPEFDVIGVARDGASLLRIAAHLRPDVVITDFEMPVLTVCPWRSCFSRCIQTGNW